MAHMNPAVFGGMPRSQSVQINSTNAFAPGFGMIGSFQDGHPQLANQFSGAGMSLGDDANQ